MGTKDNKNLPWLPHDQMTAEETAPGVVRRIGAFCDEAMCVENTFQKGGIGAMHCHEHTQITYVASGVFEFTIGEETRIVRTGDMLMKQHGVMHGCTCLEDGVLVDFFTPMRKDFL